MSTAKHTTWTAELGEVYEVRDAEGGRICIMTHLKGRSGLGGRRDSKDVAAYAHLIAAAPDLLEAVKDSPCYCIQRPVAGKAEREIAACAAIAKAESGAQ